MASRWWLAFVLLCVLALSQNGRAEVEAFRVRIVLLPGGTVSISTDDGQRFTIIGRIVALPQRLATGSQPRGTAMQKGAGQWLIQPGESQSVGLCAVEQNIPTALRTDIPGDSILFRPLTVPISVRLLIQEGRVAYSLPPGYRYRLGDVWVLQILAQTEAEATALRQSVNDSLPSEERSAVERSVQRAEKANLPVVNGTLSLEVTAKYTQSVRFVFFTVDGYPLGTSNVLPTIFRWDSTQVPDGEYVVEARAVDADGRELALVRKRLLVRNGRQ